MVMELRDITTRNVEVISGDASLKEAAVKMKRMDVGFIPVCDGDRLRGARQIRRLPVLNLDKQLVGIVSLGDIAVHTGDRDMAGETLEEISRPAAPKR